MAPSTDKQLIARVLAEDDRDAFSELVRRHQSAVRTLLRKLTGGDSALADDLAQETFVRAWKGLPHFRGGSALSSWLYRIAWNTFVSDARAARVRPGPSAATDGREAEDEVEPGTSPERVVARVDLERAFAYLRPDERVVLALTYGQDVTHEEAAAILECPLGTVKTNVLRAKNRLRHLLTEKVEAV
jgi:RNA polymerase sigma-70 factor (ECF subfamily)